MLRGCVANTTRTVWWFNAHSTLLQSRGSNRGDGSCCSPIYFPPDSLCGSLNFRISLIYFHQIRLWYFSYRRKHKISSPKEKRSSSFLCETPFFRIITRNFFRKKKLPLHDFARVSLSAKTCQTMWQWCMWSLMCRSKTFFFYLKQNIITFSNDRYYLMRCCL